MNNHPLTQYESEGGEIIERYSVWEPDANTALGTRFECLFDSGRNRATGVITNVIEGEPGARCQVLADITIAKEDGSGLRPYEFRGVQVIRLEAKAGFWGWLKVEKEKDQDRIITLGGNIHSEGTWVFKRPVDQEALPEQDIASPSLFPESIPTLDNMANIARIDASDPTVTLGMRFFCLTGKASVQGVITDITDELEWRDGWPVVGAMVKIDYLGDARRHILPEVIETMVWFRWLKVGHGVGAKALVPIEGREWGAVEFGAIKKGHLWIQAAPASAKIE